MCKAQSCFPPNRSPSPSSSLAYQDENIEHPLLIPGLSMASLDVWIIMPQMSVPGKKVLYLINVNWEANSYLSKWSSTQPNFLLYFLCVLIIMFFGYLVWGRVHPGSFLDSLLHQHLVPRRSHSCSPTLTSAFTNLRSVHLWEQCYTRYFCPVKREEARRFPWIS